MHSSLFIQQQKHVNEGKCIEEAKGNVSARDRAGLGLGSIGFMLVLADESLLVQVQKLLFMSTILEKSPTQASETSGGILVVVASGLFLCRPGSGSESCFLPDRLMRAKQTDQLLV